MPGGIHCSRPGGPGCSTRIHRRQPHRSPVPSSTGQNFCGLNCYDILDKITLYWLTNNGEGRRGRYLEQMKARAHASASWQGRLQIKL